VTAEERRGRAGSQREVLAFSLAGEEHGIDLRRLREIIRPRPVTEVPRAPAAVLGIISVRGEIMPVLDLRQRLRKPALGPPVNPRDARVLIVTREAETYGLLVDAVHQVVRLREDEIEPAPALLTTEAGELIAGIGRPRPDRILILLDLDAVLAFKRGRA
jgi:purine-binding chemotaxis protein CheW